MKARTPCVPSLMLNLIGFRLLPCFRFKFIHIPKFENSIPHVSARNKSLISIQDSGVMLVPSIQPLIRSSHRFRLSLLAWHSASLGTLTRKDMHNLVFVLGPPGSGKGTICAKIQKSLNYAHLSAGDLLRAERQREESEFGALIESHIKNGSIVPAEITCSLLENAMNTCGDVKGFLVDGFPRNENNLKEWNMLMESKVHVQFVLFLSCPVPICIERCLNRGQGRSDDNVESLKKRVETYNQQTFPIIDHFEKSGLIREVKSERTVDEVYADVVEVFKTVNNQ